MNIILSKSESHPLTQEVYPLDKNDKRAIFVYGLAKKRGDNIIASSRISDHFFTVLSGHTPRLAYYEIPEIDPVEPQDEVKARMQDAGIRIDFIGVAYNLRKSLNAEAYKTMLDALAKAVE